MGVFTSKNVIKNLLIKLGEYLGQYVTVLVALEKLKAAWKEYSVAKKVAASLCKTFLKDKIARKVHDLNVSSENMMKMMLYEELSIQKGQDLKQIRGRNNKHPVLKAEITNFVTGVIRTIDTQK